MKTLYSLSSDWEKLIAKLDRTQINWVIDQSVRMHTAIVEVEAAHVWLQFLKMGSL